MVALSKIVPISEMRTRQNELLRMLADSPLVLTQHGRAAAVLMSPEQWDSLIERLEYLEDSLAAIEARADTEPTVGFDEYLAKRGERVQDPVKA